MIRMVNRLSGGDMWVHESRVEEYLAAGHKLAAPPAAKRPLVRPEEAPEKKTAKSRRK